MRIHLRLFRNHPYLVIGVVGFTSGIPLSLTVGTIQAWLASLGVDIRFIGLFTLAGLPYTLKFLWSPLLDRYRPPFGGRRRGWVSLAYGLLALVVACLGLTHPKAGIWPAAILTFILAFLSASADIADDAYRTELFPPRQQGVASSLHITGLRIGMLFAGAAALWLSDRTSWRVVFCVVALGLVPGAWCILQGPEPRQHPRPATLREAAVQPFREFMSRPSAWEMLAFILLYKLGDTLCTVLLNPFLLEKGFSATDIALATQRVGIAALVGGGLLGGWILRVWSLKASLWFFGILQAACILVSFALAVSGRSHPLLYGVIGVENGVFAMGSVGYMTIIAEMCNLRNTATQFAMLTSISALSRVVLPSVAGFLVTATGWPVFFLICCAVSVLGLLLLPRFDRWDLPGTSAEDGPGAEA